MTAHDRTIVGGILLAAGGSTRFGRPKQLAVFEGATLIRRSAAALAATECDVKLAILGHAADASKTEIRDLHLDIRVNENWRGGMSSSLKFGLEEALRIKPELTAIMVTLVDQPYITTDILNALIEEYRRIRPAVVTSEYNDICGVPALFASEMFDEIMLLNGDKGAQLLIRSALGKVTRIPVPEAAFDIDSPDDIKLDRGEIL